MGSLILMLEPSASRLNARWWMVDSCIASIGEQGLPPSFSLCRTWAKVHVRAFVQVLNPCQVCLLNIALLDCLELLCPHV